MDYPFLELGSSDPAASGRKGTPMAPSPRARMKGMPGERDGGAFPPAIEGGI